MLEDDSAHLVLRIRTWSGCDPHLCKSNITSATTEAYVTAIAGATVRHAATRADCLPTMTKQTEDMPQRKRGAREGPQATTATFPGISKPH